MNKTAAMFGLDARIALAIFGALSVISGATLYSAIQNARATALLTRMTEVGKAWESYYIDTGENLTQNSTDSSSGSFYILNAGLLNSSSARGWRGPYTNMHDNGPRFETEDNLNIYIMTLRNKEDWTLWNSGKCETGENCSIWVYMEKVLYMGMGALIDRKVDGIDDDDAGNFRYYCADDIYGCRLQLKIAPTKNPND